MAGRRRSGVLRPVQRVPAYRLRQVVSTSFTSFIICSCLLPAGLIKSPGLRHNGLVMVKGAIGLLLVEHGRSAHLPFISIYSVVRQN